MATKPEISPCWLTVKEAAKFLQVKTTEIQGWMKTDPAFPRATVRADGTEAFERWRLVAYVARLRKRPGPVQARGD